MKEFFEKAISSVKEFFEKAISVVRHDWQKEEWFIFGAGCVASLILGGVIGFLVKSQLVG